MESPLVLAYILIIVGLLLMVAELFIPSGGILFVLSISAIAIGVILTFVHGQTTYGIPTLIGVFILVPVIVTVGLHYWPRTPMGKRMFQTGPEEDATVASMPVNLELERLRGSIGRSVSPLRPAGMVRFGDAFVDVVAEGSYVPEGNRVQVVEIEGNRIVVKEV